MFPSNTNLTVATFCYGHNASQIQQGTPCYPVLQDAKLNAGYISKEGAILIKILLGFHGDDVISYLNFLLYLLFEQIRKEWPNCLPSAQLAVCQYIFPPVLDNEDLILSINRSFCQHTRDVECKDAWRKADEQINDFVKKCEKEWPVLKYLHMPYCSLMPYCSVSNAKNCIFGGKLIYKSNLTGMTFLIALILIVFYFI